MATPHRWEEKENEACFIGSLWVYDKAREAITSHAKMFLKANTILELEDNAVNVQGERL